MRYIGQNYELPVDVTGALHDLDALREAFFAAHVRSYGYADRMAPVEIVNVRAKALAHLVRGESAPNKVEGPVEPVSMSRTWFSAHAPVETPVYDRAALPMGTELRGPAILSQFDATTVVPPGARLVVDEALNLIIEIDHDPE